MAATAVRYSTLQRVDGSTQHTSVEVTDPLLWQGQRQARAEGGTSTPQFFNFVLVTVRVAKATCPSGTPSTMVQFLGDVWAKAILPEPQEGLKRRRPPALPVVWQHLVRGSVDLVAWEDVHYQVVAHCSSRAVPPKIPEAQRFTSVTRLREIEPGMEAVLEVFGKVREGERSLGGLLKKIYVYDGNAKTVAQTDKAWR